MEIAIVIVLTAIFIAELVGVRALIHINRKMTDRPHHIVDHTSHKPDIIQSGVLPIKRKSEVEQWESEMARHGVRSGFN